MIVVRNRVLLTLMLLAAAAAPTTGFVDEAPNRLTSGQPIALWHAVSLPILVALCVLAGALLLAAFLRPSRALHWGVVGSGAALLLLLLLGAGEAAAMFAISEPSAARCLLGAAFWIMSLCAALAIVDALQRLDTGPVPRLATVLAILGATVLIIAAGRLDALSILREYAVRRGAFAAECLRHCQLVLGALVPALVIGAPLGLLAARRPGARSPIFAVLNVLQTIPSVALFGLLIAPLSALGTAVPVLGRIGIGGIGFAPAILALMLYALLPVVRNTEAGITGVDAAVIETARGMGFTPRQILWRVELPLGLPVFLAGLRIVLVQAIGLAVVAALIGAGGLGTFVFQGLGQYAIDLVLLGAVPTILLALAADFMVSIIISLVEMRRAR